AFVDHQTNGLLLEFICEPSARPPALCICHCGHRIRLSETVHETGSSPTCIASRYEAPLFAVRSCISRADDLLGGKSYYMVEVEAVIDLLGASNRLDNHLFLLDELFRGTNAVERVAAAHAVLEELIGSPPAGKAHCVVAATHDGELGGMLHSYDSFHFTDTLGPNGLEFDYKLRRGVAKSRTAIALLKLHGAPTAMIDKALGTATRLDRERGSS
ncbi:MAG: hypothetical protein Q8O42_23615, partial [Acidobacteriota bacterium]|nr:hypothetical protein [Acidobacteriota bacterium]